MGERKERLLRLRDVVERTGLSRSSIYRLAAAGEFPRQRRLRYKLAVWLESEVDAWIAETWDAAA